MGIAALVLSKLGFDADLPEEERENEAAGLPLEGVAEDFEGFELELGVVERVAGLLLLGVVASTLSSCPSAVVNFSVWDRIAATSRGEPKVSLALPLLFMTTALATAKGLNAADNIKGERRAVSLNLTKIEEEDCETTAAAGGGGVGVVGLGAATGVGAAGTGAAGCDLAI